MDLVDNNAHLPDEEKVALTSSSVDLENKSAVASVVTDHDDHDTSKTKFINGGADHDATVTIEDPGSNSTEFVGLTKEELMKYSNDPYWVKIRWVLLIGFWVIWFAMLVSAVVIIVLAPKCPPRPDLEWYEKAVGYQVVPAAFKDSGDDGIGDLDGIASKLDYLRNSLNVTALVITPIFASMKYDLGYDATDFKTLDDKYGTMDDFKNLRVAMHKKGMKLVMNFSPQQTSIDHQWFTESRKDKTNDHAAFYTWADAAGAEQSVYGGSAWTLDATPRNQHYLHHYSKNQPWLDLTNDKASQEMSSVLKFWLDNGVDGFYINDVDYLTRNADETATVLGEWRSLLDGYTEEHGYKVLMGSVTSTIGNGTLDSLDLIQDDTLLQLKQDCNGKCVSDKVEAFVKSMPKARSASWMIGDHNTKRASDRVGADKVNALNMMLLTLPGTPVTYYGEEIGMTRFQVPFADAKDLVIKDKGEAYYNDNGRDHDRTPMQWNVDAHAGFTTGAKPWLPVNTDYTTRNVKTQTAHGVGVSELEIYMHLSLLRQQPSFQWGDFEALSGMTNVFAYTRQAMGFPGYLVAINFGDARATLNFHQAMPKKIPKDGKVAANTANFQDIGHARDFAIGNSLSLENIHLRVGEGLIIEWPWSAVQALTEDQ